jgi:LacI family transcriptional regulator
MANLTLESIAKKAGVSRSTVSRVINDQPNVSQAVRDRVLDIVRETGYQPHQAARSLASRNTHVIGLVIPRSVQTFFADPYFQRLIQGIAEGCNHSDFTLSLFLIQDLQSEKKLIPRIMQRSQLDGIIIQATHLGDNIIPQIALGDVPLLVAGRPINSSAASYIDVDNVRGAQIAVEHLIGLGKQRIMTVTGALDTSVGVDRLEGYKKALRAHDLPYSKDWIVEGDFTETQAYQATGLLLAQKPDAIFCGSDVMAAGVLKRLRHEGIAVPDQVAVVGFDDLPPARLADPPLTTIRQPIRRFGLKAVETLIEIIHNPTFGQIRVIMETELVIRDSCGAKIATT